MTVEFDKSFERSLRRIHSQVILSRLKQIILQIETTTSLSELPNIRKLTGFSDYCRIRIGDYRVGFEVINAITIRFILIAHRRDIYKLFP
ncbi:MAG: type II toxin-antitoxin system RelE/ParE family toxin [Lentimicrobiaceae bacterium]|nr:type II toxin-antitoxin system RelE/ParE family toxin [Lentimicrobiaceae bacterium]